jgi:hypothetical protein
VAYVIVNDASCLIDVKKGQLLHAMLSLPYQFAVPLPVRVSEVLDFTDQEWRILDDGGACQLVSKQTNLLCGRWYGQLGRNTSSLTPHGHGFTSERAVVDGGDEMTTGVECVVDGTMG